MTEGRPVRLTFPGYDVGAADIMTGGRCAGFVLGEFYGWRAYLYPALQDRRIRPEVCEEVTGRTLGEVRETLRKRVDTDGPWWS